MKLQPGKKCRSPPSCIEAKDGTIIMEKLQNLGTMERIHTVCELFEDERGAKPMSHKQSGLPILEDEVVCALKGMAKGKAPGPDGLSFEMLDAFGEFGIDTITRLANKFYNEGKFTTEMTKSVFITMPEKAGATKCEQVNGLQFQDRGLRQRCNMSPDLFTRYADRIMRVVKELDGVHTGGVNINSNLYARLEIS